MIVVGTKLESVPSLEIVSSTMFSTLLIENWYMVYRQNNEEFPYGVALFLDGVCAKTVQFNTIEQATLYMMSMQRLAQVLG